MALQIMNFDKKIKIDLHQINSYLKRNASTHTISRNYNNTITTNRNICCSRNMAMDRKKQDLQVKANIPEVRYLDPGKILNNTSHRNLYDIEIGLEFIEVLILFSFQFSIPVSIYLLRCLLWEHIILPLILHALN